MKKLLKISAIIILLLVTVIAAKAYFITTVKLSDVQIKNLSGAMVKIGCSQNTLTSKFGTPTKVSNFVFETANKSGYLVTYNGNSFYFLDDKLTGFELTTAAFTLTFGNPAKHTAVGSSLNMLPKGFTSKNRGADHAKSYDLKNHDGKTTDQFLEYDYSTANPSAPNNGRINRIIYGDY